MTDLWEESIKVCMLSADMIKGVAKTDAEAIAIAASVLAFMLNRAAVGRAPATLEYLSATVAAMIPELAEDLRQHAMTM